MSAEPPAVDACIRARECEEVIVKVASNRTDFDGAFRLIYRSYLRAGLCSPSPHQLRITPYHLLPSTDVLVAKLRGEVISTLSLVRDGELGLPLESVYCDEVNRRRAAGLRLAEVSCLADRRKEPARFFGLFCDLSKIMVQMAASEGIDQLLIAVHPRHARMYCRAMSFQQFGDTRDYPMVNGNAAVALTLDLEWVRTEQALVWERFVGDPLPQNVIQRRPMAELDRKHFESLMRMTESAEPCSTIDATVAGVGEDANMPLLAVGG